SESALTYLQTQIYNDFVRNFQRLQANLSPRPIGLKDIPPELRRKFTSEQGRFLLHIQPAVDIWDREGALRFVTELRSVDPEVTGTPIITFEAIRFMERSYQDGTVYAIVLVSFVTALMLRRPREILLALLPLALGLLWPFGLGLLLTLGSATSLVAALVVLPVLLRLLHRAPAAPPTWRYEAPAPPPVAAVQRGDDR